MNGILQGTTPYLRIRIDTNDLLVTDILALELTFRQLAYTPRIKHLQDVELDPDTNRILYHFTEEETLALDPRKPLSWQLRLKSTDGEVMGTKMVDVDIYDLISNSPIE